MSTITTPVDNCIMSYWRGICAYNLEVDPGSDSIDNKQEELEPGLLWHFQGQSEPLAALSLNSQTIEAVHYTFNCSDVVMMYISQSLWKWFFCKRMTGIDEFIARAIKPRHYVRDNVQQGVIIRKKWITWRPEPCDESNTSWFWTQLSHPYHGHYGREIGRWASTHCACLLPWTYRPKSHAEIMEQCTG